MIRTRALLAWLPFVVVVTITGCFDPDLDEGAFLCQQVESCPDDFLCVENEPEPGILLRTCKRESLVEPRLGLEILEPATALPADQAVPVKAGGKVVLRLTLFDFILDAAAKDGPPQQGHGHVHIYLDEVSNGSYLGPAVSREHAIDVKDLSAGVHTLYGRLAQNNHELIDGPRDEVDINVVP